MKTAVFFILDDYADWEGAYLSTTLNGENDWQVKTASITKEVKSIGGFTTVVDYTLDLLPEKIDLLVLIGGKAWHLASEELNRVIQAQLDNDSPLAAICGAADYLARNGFLNYHQHTGNALFFWQDFKQYTNRSQFKEVQVLRDRNLVTANGTATLAFTEEVLKMIQFAPQTEIEQGVKLHQLGFYQFSEQFGNPYL